MTEATFGWRLFLQQWSEEWADACDPDDFPDETALRDRWLGFAPATAARIAAAEERLGCHFPPSYRAFLEVSDGWREAGGFVELLAGTADARWYEDESGFGEFYREELTGDAAPEEVLRAGMWSRALQLDVESDSTYVLMDPLDVSEDGEWAVYRHSVWAAAPPERYASFRAFMEAMYRQFHCLKAHGGGEKEFVNATTRALDAVAEEAWHLALRGEYEQARAALAEPDSFGRPRAEALLGQIRQVLGETTFFLGGRGMSAAVWHQECPPPQGDAGHDNNAPAGIVGPFGRRRPPTHYTAPGPFGDAVAEARELARWGDTETAWRTVITALPRWQPLDGSHVAPFGLIQDALLGPLMTHDRRRELLAVPRGPHARGEAPTILAPSPDGLAWLAAGQTQGPGAEGYRFVLVEGVDPVDLPGLLGPDEEAVLDEPVTSWEARWQQDSGRRECSSYSDQPRVAVGRAAAGWSFAFDREAGRIDRQRFVSPAAAASRAGRAVVVWSSHAENSGPPVFHVSVAENGAEQYAFTAAQEADVVRSGQVPSALDPDLFFASASDRHAWLSGERRALEAIAAAFGVSLPRFALTSDCRLHHFRTRSWTRPPRDGETYFVMSSGPGVMRWRQGSTDT
ncbi:SMI1/KNR4 family protein [Streptomyces telluris]|uniref:SMI1/KNR4 family protein n=2 Tax=Streptomyces telluris TaxID=2720021 RepID=A0A9X2RPG2_9ACTN|nr:SMI1/KNR4 family protein [Streptomyces telluris]MCQ8773069.1 SMI1/KNR4 family protein [Streptomyces telluris]